MPSNQVALLRLPARSKDQALWRRRVQRLLREQKYHGLLLYLLKPELSLLAATDTSGAPLTIKMFDQAIERWRESLSGGEARQHSMALPDTPVRYPIAAATRNP